MVGIVRVSTEMQAADSRAGLERQREVIRRTIDAKNLHCVEVVELHVSGTVAVGHPEMLRIFSRISDGSIKGVVVAELDRLFRPDEPSSYAALQVFKDMGANIFSGDTEYDLTTPNGLLHSSIRGAIAGFELSLIKERMQGAKEAKRRAGKCPTSAVTMPLGVGYDRKNDMWHYTSDISRVKLLFDLFDQQGIRNYSELGRKMGLGPASVKCVLRNPIYTGWRVIDKKRGTKRVSATGKPYRVKVARAESEVIKHKVLDGIISEECFQRVQAEIAITKFNHNERHRSDDAVNIGTGIAFCGCCGQPMFCISGRRKSGSGEKIGYYQCKANHYLYKRRLNGCVQRHLNSNDVDKAIITLGATVLRSEAHLSRMLAESYRRSTELVTPFAQVAPPSAQLDDLLKRDKRLLDAYEEGAITVDELRHKREALRQKRAAIEEASNSAKPVSKDGFLAMARMVVKGARRFAAIKDKRQQKQVIHALLYEVHIRQDQIISFRFRPSALAAGWKDQTTSTTVLLPKPIVIGDQPESVPPGRRRCIKCNTVKAEADFYRKLNRCNACRTVEERVRYERRKAAKAAKQ